MKHFYEPFFTQGLTQTPSGWPPPNQWIYTYGDALEFKGLYIQDTSDQMRIAHAQGIKTRGRFVTAPDVPLSDGMTVRRMSDNVYFKIIGDPKQSPARARAQVKTFEAEITERPVS